MACKKRMEYGGYLGGAGFTGGPGDPKKKKAKDVNEQSEFYVEGQLTNPYAGKSYHAYPAAQEYKDFVESDKPPFERTFGDKMYDLFHSTPRVRTVFAYGGPTRPQYEAEGGEVVDGGIPTAFNGGSISPNSSTSGKINGNSHEQGGVDMAGGKRVFSDRLYVDPNFLNDLDI